MEKKTYEAPEALVLGFIETDSLMGNLHSKESNEESYSRKDLTDEEESLYDNDAQTYRPIWDD